MGRYRNLIQKADKKDYPLKALLPAGILLMELTGYRYNTVYDRGVVVILSQLYTPEDARDRLKLYWASRAVYLILCIVFSGMLMLLSKPDAGTVVFALLLFASVMYFTDKDIRSRLDRRRTRLRLDFPDFLNRLALLVNAGMTVENAMKRIVESSDRATSPLFRELQGVLAEINAGKPDLQAYENLAKRCRIPEITRFVSILVLNLRKGSAELVSVLRVCANECWQIRKNAARKMGEEASTKMLLPLMLVFVAILLIAATPAMLALMFV